MIMRQAADDDDETSCQGGNQNPDRLPSSNHASISFKATTTTTAIVVLCYNMLAYSFLVISVFPYAGYMVVNLVPNAQPDTVGSAAGWLASAFHFGIVSTAILWGKAANIYGRKSVILLSFGLMGSLSILFGMAQSLTWALSTRLAMGMSCCIIATLKTLVSDLVGHDEDPAREAQAMNWMLGMWGWGFLVAPVISGFLAEPLAQYPEFFEDHKDSWAATLLRKFPFILPNMLGCILAMIAIVLTHFYIPDGGQKGGNFRSLRMLPRDVLYNTMLQMHGRCFSNKDNSHTRYQSLPSSTEADSMDDSSTSISEGLCQEVSPIGDAEDCELRNRRGAVPTTSAKSSSMEKADNKDRPEEEESLTMQQLFARPQTRSCLLVYWGLSFCSLAMDEMFPLYCISPTAGLGLPEADIGKVLSVGGILFAAGQFILQSTNVIYRRFGLMGSIRCGAVAVAPTFLLFPISRWIQQASTDDKAELAITTFAYLSIALAVNRLCLLVFFGNISVAVNRSAPASSRAVLNGLSVLGGSIFKALGPAFSGIISTAAIRQLGQYGSLIMFGSLAMASAGVATSSFVFLKEDSEDEKCKNGMEEVELIESKSEHKIPPGKYSDRGLDDCE